MRKPYLLLLLFTSCVWLHSPEVQDPLRNLHNARMAIEAVPGAKAAADSISPWVSVGRLGLNIGWGLAELVTGVREVKPPTAPQVGYSGAKPSLGAFSVAPAPIPTPSVVVPTPITPIPDRLHSDMTPVGDKMIPTATPTLGITPWPTPSPTLTCTPGPKVEEWGTSWE